MRIQPSPPVPLPSPGQAAHQAMDQAQHWPGVDIVHLTWQDAHGHTHHVHKLQTLQDAHASPEGRLYFQAGAQIDVDGSGPHYGNPDAQDQTSLHTSDGVYLNADETPFFVLPPQVADHLGIHLGDYALIRNRANGQATGAIFGDLGPHEKIGEVSRLVAQTLGVNPSPTVGGVDQDIQYLVFPGSAGYSVEQGQYPAPAVVQEGAIQERLQTLLGGA